jgi:uncharacterized protein (UPF0371 family)
MFIKNKDAARIAKQNEMLRKMYEAEREKSAGHEELAKIQNAYIAILLKKLGATNETPVTITNEDVKEVLGSDIVRVSVSEKGVWRFYIEESKE